MTKSNQGKSIEAKDPHWIEWVTGLVSALIVIVVIGLIAKDAFTDTDVSPELAVSVTATEQRSGGSQIAFEISNKASVTASQVTIRGDVREGETIVESAETVVDYVPGRSKARGGLIFRSDLSGRTVDVRASSFNEP